MRTILFLALAGCGARASPDDTGASPTTNPEATSEPTADPGPVCDADARQSTCGMASSLVQGRVRLAPELGGPTTGDLFVALVHEAYSGGLGGGYHTHTVVRGADLSEPVPFVLDMCVGSAMWTEDNCTYALQVILDQDGNQGPENLLPDPGEPATLVSEVRVSCDEEAPCLDIVLDCTTGSSCGTFADLPTCACEPDRCGSDFALCQ